MAVEIRACLPAEMSAYNAVVNYVFADPGISPTGELETAPEWTTAGFVDGRVVSSFCAFPFTVRWNGEPVPTAGVSQVGTLPGYRRRGILRQIMTQAFGEMRDRKQPVAILWASMAAIYQRFGYGLASRQVAYTFDPRSAGLQEPFDTPGQVSLETPEEAYGTIKQVYVQWATPRTLAIHRSRALWQASTLRPPKKDQPLFVAVYRDTTGEPRGYCVYSTSEAHLPTPGPDQVMNIQDFVALDLEAWKSLWLYVCAHDLVREVRAIGPFGEDDPAMHVLMEPRMLSRHVSDGIWLRMVDVEPALAARGYSARGEVVIEVADELCPWNAGRYLVQSDGRRAEVSRTNRPPDIATGPNGLASLYAGAQTATALARAGRVSVANDAAGRAVDDLFRTAYQPHCPDSF